MTFRWLYPFAALAMLFGLLVALANPASAAVPGPLPRDAACAASLTASYTQGDELRVLGCDPAGRGLAVVALGDPDTARSVAVIVPGSDMDLHTRAHVHAARVDADWMKWVPSIELGDLGHGADPTSSSSGATLLPTAGVTAHNGYLTPGTASLAAVAAIAGSSADDAGVAA